MCIDQPVPRLTRAVAMALKKMVQKLFAILPSCRDGDLGLLGALTNKDGLPDSQWLRTPWTSAPKSTVNMVSMSSNSLLKHARLFRRGYLCGQTSAGWGDVAVNLVGAQKEVDEVLMFSWERDRLCVWWLMVGRNATPVATR